MKLILTVILFITSYHANSQQTVTFYTKDSDRVTLRGVDTLIDFAGNYKVNDNRQHTKVKHANMQYNTEEQFWANVVLEKLFGFYTKSKQKHKVE